MAPYTYQQAKSYYYGLPSRPTFVASTIDEVRAPPTGPEAYTPTKMLRAIGEHKIVELWEADIADQVIARLTAMNVDWTSLDVVRIGIATSRGLELPTRFSLSLHGTSSPHRA